MAREKAATAIWVAVIGAMGLIVAAAIQSARSGASSPPLVHYTANVWDSESKPVIRANVTIKIGDAVIPLSTDSDGFFSVSFPRPQSDSFRVSITSAGFDDFDHAILLDFPGTKHEVLKISKTPPARRTAATQVSLGQFVLGRLVGGNAAPTRERVRSTSWQHSSSQDDLVNTYRVTVPSGYRLVPESVKIVVEFSRGRPNEDWSVQPVVGTSDINFLVKTVHHALGVSGALNFHAEYDIERLEGSWQFEDLLLNWNTSLSKTVEARRWKLMANFLDGEHREFTQPDSYRYVTLSLSGEMLTIRILPQP